MRFVMVSAVIAAILLSAFAFRRAAAQSSGNIVQTPLILEKDDGEHRVRIPRDTPMATGPFTIKIDRKNGGSQKMWLGAEEIPPGGLIPRHKHMGQDEILLVQTGAAHVWLGTQERDVHAGAIVYIPSDTWVSLKNSGTENISLAFVFSDPGFDDFMRCASVPAGETSTKLSPEEFKACQQQGHVEFEAAPQKK
jgi:mannose-6-phosphate isomerase-like protein (cupin superfamily)